MAYAAVFMWGMATGVILAALVVSWVLRDKYITRKGV